MIVQDVHTQTCVMNVWLKICVMNVWPNVRTARQLNSREGTHTTQPTVST
jgi:hypothetical protein